MTLKLYYRYAKQQHIDYEIVALENGSKDIRIHFLSSDFMPSLVLLWKTPCEGYADWIWSAGRMFVMMPKHYYMM